jgi:hypothetical protein
MVKLPADGKYFVHLSDTRRHAGMDHAYRLRISQSGFVNGGRGRLAATGDRGYCEMGAFLVY